MKGRVHISWKLVCSCAEELIHRRRAWAVFVQNRKQWAWPVSDRFTWWISFVIHVLYLGECSSGICDEASCINGGTCTASKADSYICLCPLGFRGRHCEDGEKDANWWQFLSLLLIPVGVIFHQCIFSKVPCIFMGLTLLCWEGWENLFSNQVEVSSYVKVANWPKDKLILWCSWADALVSSSWPSSNSEKPIFVWFVSEFEVFHSSGSLEYLTVGRKCWKAIHRSINSDVSSSLYCSAELFYISTLYWLFIYIHIYVYIHANTHAQTNTHNNNGKFLKDFAKNQAGMKKLYLFYQSFRFGPKTPSS